MVLLLSDGFVCLQLLGEEEVRVLEVLGLDLQLLVGLHLLDLFDLFSDQLNFLLLRESLVAERLGQRKLQSVGALGLAPSSDDVVHRLFVKLTNFGLLLLLHESI